MASLPEELFFAEIAELNRHLLNREFKAEELARAFGERLEKIGPRYNALAFSLTHRAIKKAKDVDGDLKRGRTRGPLQGIPFGASDVLSVAKTPSAWGAEPYSKQVFDETATAVARIEKAGGLLTGKLSTLELSGLPRCGSPAASVSGPGLNPWNRSRWSGGPSSGSAIAVAAGLAPFALASEVTGSLIVASAYSGVTGLRPTYGLVSRSGVMPGAWTLDKVGVMARSAADCGSVLHAAAGSDHGDPSSAGKSFYFFEKYQRPVNQIRVGFSERDFSDRPGQAARSALAAALDTLRSLSIPLKEVSLPDFPYEAIEEIIAAAEAGSVFEPLIRGGGVDRLSDPVQIGALRASLDLRAADYLKAMRLRRMAIAKIHELFIDNVDLLAAPASPSIAPLVSEPFQPAAESFPMTDRGLVGLVTAGNLAGLPALALPCGFADGMPVGIQFTGLPFSENLLLRMGTAFQGATDWHRRRPPVS